MYKFVCIFFDNKTTKLITI